MYAIPYAFHGRVIDMDLKDLKIMAWAMQIANEYDAVPDLSRLDDVCDVFGDEDRGWYELAIQKYCGYSYLDVSSMLGRTVRDLEIPL